MSTPAPQPLTKEQMIARREKLCEDIKYIHKHILDNEEIYIAESSHLGNVIKGWDGYLNATDLRSNPVRRPKITEKERIFSTSSILSFQDDNMDDDDGFLSGP